MKKDKQGAKPGALRIVTGGDAREEIILSAALSDLTDKGAEALARDGEIYQRGGSLSHVVTPGGAPGIPTTPTIRDLPLSTLRVRLSQCARWVKYDARKQKYAEAPVPESITRAIFDRGQWDAVRPLVHVLTAPTMRPDGSILQTPGYDETTALLLWPAIQFVEVPDEPTVEDARGAAEAILDLVCDFPFATESDRSAWLAAVLTLVARAAIEGPCPLFAVDANTRATGKSKLVDCAVILAYGHKAERTSLSTQEEELRKQITSLLKNGAPSILIDNVKSGSRLGGASFDALLTSTTWKERDLGKTHHLTLPARAVWFATGNNIGFSGDLPRRTIKITLRSKLEDPEHRTGLKHGDGDELLHVVENRRRFLVTQALTVLRAFVVAGRPKMGPTWGSFEGWSRLIADAVRWCGFADPLLCRATADESADEDRMHASAVIAGLVAMGGKHTARELISQLYPHDRFENDTRPDAIVEMGPMREALEAATSAKGAPNAQHVGRFLRRVLGRVIDGQAISCELDTHRKIQTWFAQRVES